MQLDETFFEIPCDVVAFDGKVEHTELTDIDRAVAAFFQNVLDSLVVTDTKRRENSEFSRFVGRNKSRKIYYGNFNDPVSFLSKLTAKLGDKVKANRNELLPVCYITRDPVIGFVDGAEYVDIPDCGELTNEKGQPYAVINKSFVALTYRINTLAWNQSTLSRLALGLMVWLRHTKGKRKHVFRAKTMLASTEMEISIEIRGRKDAMTEPAEVDHENTRLFASSISFEVIAEVYEAESITVRQGAIGVGGRVIE
ncbi:hypothetical protein NMS21_004827 [Vibrio alginolyticus]|nr:hypothetical protein [Vibrio alginolyticus]